MAKSFEELNLSSTFAAAADFRTETWVVVAAVLSIFGDRGNAGSSHRILAHVKLILYCNLTTTCKTLSQKMKKFQWI